MKSSLISTSQAAQLADVSTTTIQRWIAGGRLAAEKLPGRTGAFVIRRGDLDALLASLPGGKPEARAS